jgi:hypothetical protein
MKNNDYRAVDAKEGGEIVTSIEQIREKLGHAYETAQLLRADLESVLSDKPSNKGPENPDVINEGHCDSPIGRDLNSIVDRISELTAVLTSTRESLRL